MSWQDDIIRILYPTEIDDSFVYPSLQPSLQHPLRTFCFKSALTYLLIIGYFFLQFGFYSSTLRCRFFSAIIDDLFRIVAR